MFYRTALMQPLPFDIQFPKLNQVLRFQREVLFPFLEVSRLPQKLETRNWMGLQDGGLTFADLLPTEAEKLITLLGPSAFKVVRFSPDLLKKLTKAKKKGQPIITSGGSCLITSADKASWKNHPPTDEEIRIKLANLPHLMQIFDASLPLHCSDQHINIIEDSLFTELGHECSQPSLNLDELAKTFHEEGQRHSDHFQKLSWQFQSGAQVLPTYFSELPVAQASQAFWQTPEVFNLIRQASSAIFSPEAVGQFQVMFSFTGGWANMLREVGHIPTNSCYLVVEPFHHFTEASERDQHLKSSTDRWKIYAGFDNLMTAQPYGKSGINAGIQGGIAFMPVLTPMGKLGHTNLLLEDCCSSQSAEAFLTQRRQTLMATKVPSPHENLLFTDSLNYLFHLPQCREALSWLMQQTLTMRAESAKLDKGERKTLLKGLRSNPDVLASSLERYTLLYQELEKLVHHFFD